MIQGTGSGVGKSLFVVALCRILRDMGIKVAPFKAQNMALNSFVTKEGGEIGRAQALQAEAAGIEPSIDINPILLKVSGDRECQVILKGKVYGNMKAGEYYAIKDTAWDAVTSAYDRLSKRYDVIVIEGAGSPAEINLMDDEIVNMRIARYTDAPVILVGDINRGGVFASLYGTIELLRDISNPAKGGLCDADYIKAFIINKFRGDIEILRPGLRMIEEKTGRPVIGVLPYIPMIGLPEEDGLSLEGFKGSKVQMFRGSEIKIVVLRLRYISNFTDLDPFLYEPDVELLYSVHPGDIKNADLIIIPGSKNTIRDLLFLREDGIEECIKHVVKEGTPIIGICGGYQMLGKKIYDPYGVESLYREIDGIGLLNIETTFQKEKITSQVEAELMENTFHLPSFTFHRLLRGYEIHKGISKGDIGLFRVKRTSRDHELILDGSKNGDCIGTYIHGIFEDDLFRRAILNHIRRQKGLAPLNSIIRYSEIKEAAIDNIADIVRDCVDINYLKQLIGL